MSTTLLPRESSQIKDTPIANPSAFTLSVRGTVFFFTRQIILKFTSLADDGVKQSLMGSLQGTKREIAIVTASQLLFFNSNDELANGSQLHNKVNLLYILYRLCLKLVGWLRYCKGQQYMKHTVDTFRCQTGCCIFN